MTRPNTAAPAPRAAVETASRTPADRRRKAPAPPNTTASAASHLAHQALRPEPEKAEKQRIHHHVLVHGADQIRRQGLDDADQESRHQRAGHAAEAAKRHRDQRYDAPGRSDSRAAVEQLRAHL